MGDSSCFMPPSATRRGRSCTRPSCRGAARNILRPNTLRYRARSPSAPPNRLYRQHKNEAVQPRTIAIIIRLFGGALYRPVRQTLIPKSSWWSDFAAMAVVCRWGSRGTLVSNRTTTRSSSTTILLLSWCCTL